MERNLPARISSKELDSKRLRAKVRRVGRTLERSLGIPEQKPPLPDPLDMLIATILSQNTNDKNSHRAYTAMRRQYPAWVSVARARLSILVEVIRSGGMANLKAARIKQTLRSVRHRYGSYDLSGLQRKSDEDVITELTELKGVGVKTAACVLLFSLGRDVFPVDTHVHRVCGRLGLAPGCTTPEQTFRLMKEFVPKGKAYSFHTNLIRFGRKTCRSNKPACDDCPLYSECGYPGKRKRRQGSRTTSKTDHNFMLLDNIRLVKGKAQVVA